MAYLLGNIKVYKSARSLLLYIVVFFAGNGYYEIQYELRCKIIYTTVFSAVFPIIFAVKLILRCLVVYPTVPATLHVWVSIVDTSPQTTDW